MHEREKDMHKREKEIKPVVTRFFCPPDIPLIISLPTIVSPHISSPKIWSNQSDPNMNRRVNVYKRHKCPSYHHHKKYPYKTFPVQFCP